MNKNYTQSILKYFLLIAIVLISGCGQSNVAISPTSTLAPTKTPTNTITPEPTRTPEVLYPEGVLIYSNKNGVFSFNLQTRETKVISNTDQEQGRLIVVNNCIYTLRDISGNATQFEIFKMSIDGSNLEQLTSDGNKFSFAVSPSENYIAYSPEINQLLLYDLKNRETQVVIEKEDFAFVAGSWSLDGKKLVFSENRLPLGFGSANFIYSLDDKTTTKLLPSGIGIERVAYESQPAWSPNGKNLVLNLVTNLQSGYPDIYALDVKNYDLQKIATNMDGESFTWSPNGNMILFESMTDPRKLYLFDLNSKELGLIEEGGVDFPFYYPMWSPAGDYFAYFTNKSDTDWYLNIQNTITGEKLKLEFPDAVLSAQWIYLQ